MNTPGAVPAAPTAVPTAAVVVVAAGSGTRLGRGRPKAYVECAGTTILERSLRTVLLLAEPVQIIVVAPAALVEETIALARGAGAASGTVTVVAGGASRQESAGRGMRALSPSIDTVLVHDAARALTPVDQFERVIAAVRATGSGVIPALPVTDTIKRIRADGGVVGTVDRSELAAVQTPQGFPRALLEEAYAAAEEEFTDDAALLASRGADSLVVVGDPLAFKITTPWDLARAEQVLAPPPAVVVPRVGIGTDVHAFDDASPLWLAGLHWPGERGLSGHSDGDPVAHAICDALLAAAGLGDIGSRFGTADPRFADAHGEVFLRATRELVEAAGFRIGNVSVQLIGNRPRFSPRRDEAQHVLSELLGAPVSVAATTSDTLGFTGRGEGVAATATALVLPSAAIAR
ncbi:bifunctional 2-C-methyl-D-erythritol 4-phosphate cytidylyltransferase/2-C-methyl-D-erythritol 2,4-cyclodiphosphate synthase [Rathayibacter tritici]|uniref:2-C-methyl-D-erythritol 4-phosphate cytidylyltransferase n=1 Tax=Rathayibacter tritici TaxID=33888 RepID=UPI000CE81BDF|nr:bifunctional 2-C-methyl-D-erythritol 4-phosphate cytidylyltransferase/2-C-methyl-D-erythritol 2,4-cyclodiphosphate synthase [Rathayibacter tritici]PPG08867.1 bifunctional 2-C-methyl-D-erythritol 4-phosphate cytidylyltransferase/2-C-methyl-D-erythritol 2,4-cyclodiphosphate synthase [Rathayibacter tritici]